MISDMIFGMCLLIVSVLCVLKENDIIPYFYSIIYTKNAFLVAGAAGIAVIDYRFINQIFIKFFKKYLF